MQGPPAPAPAPHPVAAPKPGRWLPLLAVAGVLLVVVFGGYVTAGALSTPTGPPVEVAGVVRVSPLSGWQEVGRSSFPLLGVKLTRGNGNLDVFAFSPSFMAAAGNSSDGLLRAYFDQFLRAQASSGRVSFSPTIERVTLRSGQSAVRASYVGIFSKGAAPLEGEVTALVAPGGAGIVFDGWAPEGLLDFVIGDVHEMIAAAEVR